MTGKSSPTTGRISPRGRRGAGGPLISELDGMAGSSPTLGWRAARRLGVVLLPNHKVEVLAARSVAVSADRAGVFRAERRARLLAGAPAARTMASPASCAPPATCAATRFFSWRAAASTVSSCRTPTSSRRACGAVDFRAAYQPSNDCRTAASSCSVRYGRIHLPAPEAQADFLADVKRSASKRSRLISASRGSLAGWPSAHKSSRTMGPITRTAMTVAGQPQLRGRFRFRAGEPGRCSHRLRSRAGHGSRRRRRRMSMGPR